MSKLLTIIIPAYNVEKYLQNCIESILCPELETDVEVLIINDGSKDKTLELARKFEKEYPNYIKAIDKQNGNYGSVMNKGLSIAEGKYFRTLDADDRFDKEAFKRYVGELKRTDADMVVTEWYFDYEGRLEKQEFEKDIETNLDIEISSDKFKLYPNSQILSIHGITYKTSLLKASGLVWDEGISYTDTEYCYWPIKHVKTIRYIPIGLYYYFIGRNEQTMSPANLRKNFKSFYIVGNSIMDNLKNNVAENKTMFELQKRYIKIVSTFIYESLLLDGDKNEDAIKQYDEKMKSISSLYEEVGESMKYKRIRYVKHYRSTPGGKLLIKLLSIIKKREIEKA